LKSICCFLNGEGFVISFQLELSTFFSVIGSYNWSSVPEKLVAITSASSGFLLYKYGEKYYIYILKNSLKFKVEKNNLADVNAIVKTFYEGVYNKFCDEIEGKVVLDIGAFIGGTPIIYFL
jgi:hypothetical protein